MDTIHERVNRGLPISTWACYCVNFYCCCWNTNTCTGFVIIFEIIKPIAFYGSTRVRLFFFSWAHASFHTLYTRPPVLNKLPAWLLVEQEKSFSSKDSLYELAACILNFESVQFIAFHSNFLECSIIIIFNWCIWISR